MREKILVIFVGVILFVICIGVIIHSQENVRRANRTEDFKYEQLEIRGLLVSKTIDYDNHACIVLEVEGFGTLRIAPRGEKEISHAVVGDSIIKECGSTLLVISRDGKRSSVRAVPIRWSHDNSDRD